MPPLKVNILLHGLFFMTQEGGNLRIYAPNIPKHHFVGGIRGFREELTVSPDLTNFGLRGKADPQTGLPAPDPVGDIDGSIMQFPTSDVGGFNGLDDTDGQGNPLFKGSILLPWPTKFIALRTGDITTTFLAKSGSIANHIVGNATGKGSSTLGVVALLQYTLPALNQVGGVPPLNIHYYLQPCSPHLLKDVDDDLKAARPSFKNPAGFDLEMFTDKEPTPIPTSDHSEFGTTKEDEQSFDEERIHGIPDAAFICRNDPLIVPDVSPANCPIFFVGP
ncbi:MAG: hypothetical protein WCE73_18080 [Candidatus Angelobacter sp.]